MRKSIMYFSLLPFIFILGCATVNKPTEVSIAPVNPVISPTQYEQDTKTLKRVVAIARFSNETNYGKGVYLNNNSGIGKKAMDIFSSKLVQSGKFIMLERSDIEYLEKESTFNKTNMAQIPADYLIIGSITDFGRKTTGDVGAFSRSQKQVAYAKVNVRLVDVKTGQIVYGETGEGEAFSEAGTVLGMGSQTGYDSTLNDKAIDAAISKLVNNIMNNLLNNPWKSYFLSKENEGWIISGGKSQGIMVGDTFLVYENGKTITNPQTNLPIELPAKKIAKVKISDVLGDNVQNEVSICQLIEGEIDKDNLSKYFISENKE